MEEGELCFPQMPNRSCRLPSVDPSQSLMSSLVLGCFSVLITTLNLLVILSIACFRQLQTSTHRIILSLAFSDFLLGLVVIPVSSWTWGQCWTWGDFACDFYYVFTVALQMASVGSVILVSVDRYIAVMDPMHYQTRMSPSKVNLCIGVLWVYAVLFCFITMNSIFNPRKQVGCLGECSVTVLVEADVVLGLVTPICIILVLYIRIFSVVVAKIRITRSNCSTLPPSQSNVRQKFELKGARNMGSVIVAFLVCFIPYYSLAYSSGDAVEVTGNSFLLVGAFLLFLNSAVNPLIYVLIYPRFRKAFRVIITLKILRSGPVIL